MVFGFEVGGKAESGGLGVLVTGTGLKRVDRAICHCVNVSSRVCTGTVYTYILQSDTDRLFDPIPVQIPVSDIVIER